MPKSLALQLSARSHETVDASQVARDLRDERAVRIVVTPAMCTARVAWWIDPRLTHRFQGRDFRLTDVHGEVVHDWLA